MIKYSENRNIKIEKGIINKFLTYLGISMLFVAIFLVYAFSVLKFLFLAISDDEGPSHLFDHDIIDSFLKSIGFIDINSNAYNSGMLFRYIFIFWIIGLFLSSLFILLLNNWILLRKDEKSRNEIIVIHDDVFQVVPEYKENGQIDYHPEKFIGKDDFTTLEKLLKRTGTFGFFLKISNILCFVAIGLMIFTFMRYDGYLYTDESRLIMTSSMLFLNFYFLLRCPDLSKAFAAMAFKRVNLGGAGKFRMHETLLGILLVLGGMMLIINGAGGGADYFERLCGLLPLILGTFLIGRDWKDFSQGKFITD